MLNDSSLNLSSELDFENELHTVITVILQQAAAEDYNSVALPLIGGPIKSLARAMGSAISEFVNNVEMNTPEVNIYQNYLIKRFTFYL